MMTMTDSSQAIFKSWSSCHVSTHDGAASQLEVPRTFAQAWVKSMPACDRAVKAFGASQHRRLSSNGFDVQPARCIQSPHVQHRGSRWPISFLMRHFDSSEPVNRSHSIFDLLSGARAAGPKIPLSPEFSERFLLCHSLWMFRLRTRHASSSKHAFVFWLRTLRHAPGGSMSYDCLFKSRPTRHAADLVRSVGPLVVKVSYSQCPSTSPAYCPPTSPNCAPFDRAGHPWRRVSRDTRLG